MKSSISAVEFSFVILICWNDFGTLLYVDEWKWVRIRVLSCNFKLFWSCYYPHQVNSKFTTRQFVYPFSLDTYPLEIWIFFFLLFMSFARFPFFANKKCYLCTLTSNHIDINILYFYLHFQVILRQPLLPQLVPPNRHCWLNARTAPPSLPPLISVFFLCIWIWRPQRISQNSAGNKPIQVAHFFYKKRMVLCFSVDTRPSCCFFKFGWRSSMYQFMKTIKCFLCC